MDYKPWTTIAVDEIIDLYLKKERDMWSDEFKKHQVGLALKIRQLRLDIGLSQEKLAMQANIDRTLVSKIERKLANPTLEVLVKIALSLNVTVDYLIKL